MSLDPSRPVHLILGDERLLVEQALSELIAAALGGPTSGFNYSSHLAGESPLSALSTARTMPMMVRRQVVLIREVENASKDFCDAILEYLGSPSDSTLFILTGQKLPPAGGKINNLVKQIGVVSRFKAGSQKPVPFAVDYARGQGCRLDGSGARMLVALVGSDLAVLRAEIDKLVCYVGGEGSISSEDVEAICSVVAEGKIWDLTDALIRRDINMAMAAAHRMLEEGQASHRLISTVTWQFRQLLELQDDLRCGRPPGGTWARAPSSKIQAAQRLLQQRPLSASRIMRALADANQAFNRSRAGDRRVFEGLIMELAAG
jgi:DNA polymerase-3 subunit delta